MRKQRCASGRPDRGENPESSKQLSEDYNEPRDDRMTTAASAAPPSPTGPPPTLTAQQRARLDELLQQRDAQGRVTYQLDKYTTNASMWAAYRVALKTSYRNRRKQPRAMGTWSRIKPGGQHATPGRLLSSTTPTTRALSLAQTTGKQGVTPPPTATSPKLRRCGLLFRGGALRRGVNAVREATTAHQGGTPTFYSEFVQDEKS